jgi:predicted phage tail protein
MRSKALLDEIAVAKEEVRQLSYINEDLRKKLNEGERQADIEKEQLDRQVEQL